MVKFAFSFFFIFALVHVHSMEIEPFQFEDLLGEISPLWYRMTSLDRERMAFFKEIFQKNNKTIPQEHQKIPKVLHWVWLGPLPFPEKSKMNILSWQALHPGWKLKFWTENAKKKPPIPGMEVHSIYSLPPSPVSHLIPKAGNYGEQSDLVRYVILFNEGGIYVDHDVMAVQSFDTLNKQFDFFSYLETPLDFPLNVTNDNFRINNGLVGVRPGHPILEKAMKNVAEVWDDLQSQYPNNDPSSQLVRTLKRTFLPFTEAAVQAIDQPGNCDIVYPASFGCPKFGFREIWIKNKLKERSLTYAEHFHDSIWCSPPQKKNKLTRKTSYLVFHIVLTALMGFFLFIKKKKVSKKLIISGF